MSVLFGVGVGVLCVPCYMGVVLYGLCGGCLSASVCAVVKTCFEMMWTQKRLNGRMAKVKTQSRDRVRSNSGVTRSNNILLFVVGEGNRGCECAASIDIFIFISIATVARPNHMGTNICIFLHALNFSTRHSSNENYQ